MQLCIHRVANQQGKRNLLFLRTERVLWETPARRPPRGAAGAGGRQGARTPRRGRPADLPDGERGSRPRPPAPKGPRGSCAGSCSTPGTPRRVRTPRSKWPRSPGGTRAHRTAGAGRPLRGARPRWKLQTPSVVSFHQPPLRPTQPAPRRPLSPPHLGPEERRVPRGAEPIWGPEAQGPPGQAPTLCWGSRERPGLERT